MSRDAYGLILMTLKLVVKLLKNRCIVKKVNFTSM